MLLHNAISKNWFTRRFLDRTLNWALPTLGMLFLLAGIYLHLPPLTGGGLIATAFWVGFAIRRSRTNRQQHTGLPPTISVTQPSPDTTELSEVPQSRPEKLTDLGMLVEEMLSHGRFALLLRPQIISNLSSGQHDRTRAALNEAMTIVPAGEVMLAEGDELADEGRFTENEVDRNRYARVTVEDFLLDRYLVTNRQFHHFVASCGYEQMSLWDPSILAAVLDFVDDTGAPGPKFWKNGRYPRGEEDYPVVGISWYEAVAYARWIGKRLPTDAEWVKAASWPVPVAAGVWQQRKFPWGNAMERNRANLWGTGPGRTVPIDQYADGASVGGVHQLVGNVWEWTTCDFGYDDLDGPLQSTTMGSALMKSLRGGAFDTYFESQATCHFRSGDHPLARKRNVGFRCALSACDVLSLPHVKEVETANGSLEYEDDASAFEPQLSEVGT